MQHLPRFDGRRDLNTSKASMAMAMLILEEERRISALDDILNGTPTQW